MKIKKKKTSDEKAIQDAVIQYLSLKKYFFWRNNTGALKTENRFIRFGAVGSPDICLVKDGKFIGLEIKDKAPQSEGQMIFEKRLKEAGGEYYIIRNVDQVMAIL